MPKLPETPKAPSMEAPKSMDMTPSVTMDNIHNHPDAPADMLSGAVKSFISGGHKDDVGGEKLSGFVKHPKLDAASASALFDHLHNVPEAAKNDPGPDLQELVKHPSLPKESAEEYITHHFNNPESYTDISHAAKHPELDTSFFEGLADKHLDADSEKHSLKGLEHFRVSNDWIKNKLSQPRMLEPEVGNMTDRQKLHNAKVRRNVNAIYDTMPNVKHDEKSLSEAADLYSKPPLLNEAGAAQAHSESIGRFIQNNPNLSSEQVEKLYHTEIPDFDDHYIDNDNHKPAAVEHPNATPKFLASVVADKNSGGKIRNTALKNPKLPEKSRKAAIAKLDGSYYSNHTASAIADNPSTTPEEISQMVKSGYLSIHHDRVSPTDIEQHWAGSSKNADIARAILKADNAPESVLAEIALKHKNMDVAAGALSHKNVTPAIVQAALKRKAKAVQDAASAHPFAIGSVLADRLKNGTTSPSVALSHLKTIESLPDDQKNSILAGIIGSAVASGKIAKDPITAKDAMKEMSHVYARLSSTGHQDHLPQLENEMARLYSLHGTDDYKVRNAIRNSAINGNEKAHAAILANKENDLMDHSELVRAKMSDDTAMKYLQADKNLAPALVGNPHVGDAVFNEAMKHVNAGDFSNFVSPSRSDVGKTVFDSRWKDLPENEKTEKFNQIAETIPHAVAGSTSAPYESWKTAYDKLDDSAKEDLWDSHRGNVFDGHTLDLDEVSDFKIRREAALGNLNPSPDNIKPQLKGLSLVAKGQSDLEPKEIASSVLSGNKQNQMKLAKMLLGFEDKDLANQTMEHIAATSPEIAAHVAYHNGDVEKVMQYAQDKSTSPEETIQRLKGILRHAPDSFGYRNTSYTDDLAAKVLDFVKQPNVSAEARESAIHDLVHHNLLDKETMLETVTNSPEHLDTFLDTAEINQYEKHSVVRALLGKQILPRASFNSLMDHIVANKSQNPFLDRNKERTLADTKLGISRIFHHAADVGVSSNVYGAISSMLSDDTIHNRGGLSKEPLKEAVSHYIQEAERLGGPIGKLQAAESLSKNTIDKIGKSPISDSEKKEIIKTLAGSDNPLDIATALKHGLSGGVSHPEGTWTKLAKMTANPKEVPDHHLGLIADSIHADASLTDKEVVLKSVLDRSQKTADPAQGEIIRQNIYSTASDTGNTNMPSLLTSAKADMYSNNPSLAQSAVNILAHHPAKLDPETRVNLATNPNLPFSIKLDQEINDPRILSALDTGSETLKTSIVTSISTASPETISAVAEKLRQQKDQSNMGKMFGNMLASSIKDGDLMHSVGRMLDAEGIAKVAKTTKNISDSRHFGTFLDLAKDHFNDPEVRWAVAGAITDIGTKNPHHAQAQSIHKTLVDHAAADDGNTLAYGDLYDFQRPEESATHKLMDMAIADDHPGYLNKAVENSSLPDSFWKEKISNPETQESFLTALASRSVIDPISKDLLEHAIKNVGKGLKGSTLRHIGQRIKDEAVETFVKHVLALQKGGSETMLTEAFIINRAHSIDFKLAKHIEANSPAKGRDESVIGDMVKHGAGGVEYLRHTIKNETHNDQWVDSPHLSQLTEKEANSLLKSQIFKAGASMGTGPALTLAENHNIHPAMVNALIEHGGPDLYESLAGNPMIAPEDALKINKEIKDQYKGTFDPGSKFNPVMLHPKVGYEVFAKHNPELEKKPDVKVDRDKLPTSVDYSPDKERLYSASQTIPPEGMSWADFKKANPKMENWTNVKAVFMDNPKQTATPEDFARHLEKHDANDFKITYTHWNGMQRHSKKENLVMQLSVGEATAKKLQSNPKLWALFKAVQRSANHAQNNNIGAHPVTPYSMGWVRIDTSQPRAGIIEEFQSDFASGLDEALENTFARKDAITLEGHTITKEEGVALAKEIKNATKHWHAAAHRAVEDLAKKQGWSDLYLHGIGVRSNLSGFSDNKAPPVYIQEMYERHPKASGWNQCDYTDYPHHSEDTLKSTKEHGYKTQCWHKKVK